MINVKEIKPMGSYLVTTKDVYEKDLKINNVIIEQKGALKEYQKVIAVGPYVRDIKAGDLVCINPARYAIHKYDSGSLKDGVVKHNEVTGYRFNIIELNHKECLLLINEDIKFVVLDYEEEEDKPASKVILPPKKKVLV